MKSIGVIVTENKNNNLNLIRLFLALGVIFSHSFPLSYGSGAEGKYEPLCMLTHGQEACSSIAVDMFFLISGMLITASWLRSKTMQNFLMRRVLRIYPGYIVSLLFSGAVIWIACPKFRANVGHGNSWSLMLLHDCIFLNTNSINFGWKGIFSDNPFPNCCNGSLWTISVEFQCYMLVAVLGLFCLFRHRFFILMATIACNVAYAMSLFHGEDAFNSNWRFLTYFLFGMCIWLWRDKIPLSKWIALGCVFGLLMACQIKPWFAFLLPFLGGYLLLGMGYAPGIHFMDWTKKTDLSYGTYFFAFPVQQLVAQHEILRVPWINFLIAVPVTLSLAWLSWNLVENRFLRMKNITHRDYDPGEGDAAVVSRSITPT